MRSRFHSVTAGAEINSIYVKLENLLFGKLPLDAQRDHCFQHFPAKSAAAERKAISGKLLSDTAGAFFRRATHDVAHQSAHDPAPINSLVCVKARVLARQHRGDEKRRDFAQGNLEPVRASQAAVNFSIDIVNSAALRHFADVLHIERLRPRPVKQENGEAGAGQ